MPSILGKERSETHIVLFEPPARQITIDLGQVYESAILRIVNPSNMANTSTLSVWVGDTDDENTIYPYIENGLTYQPAKEDIESGGHIVIHAGRVRLLFFELSLAPDDDFSFEVYGQGRITQPTDEILTQRTIPT